MELGLKNKIAVVTASSKGLGKAVAEAMAQEGARLAICSRNDTRIKETAQDLSEKYKTDVYAGVCNVEEKSSIELFAQEVIKKFGTVHVLFINAGGPPPGTIANFLPADFEKALNLNLMSAINLTYSFLPYMKKQKWGRIIASTSITVKQPVPTLVLSNVSRVGVVAFIKSLSTEVAPFNITANAVAPGYIMTDRVVQITTDRAQGENRTFDEVINEQVKNIPLGRIGRPDEFGSLVAFVASERAGYINGETILIDGGMYRGLM
jgi:3-oxoacyl-[acyl-carrier protein] reductase